MGKNIEKKENDLISNKNLDSEMKRIRQETILMKTSETRVSILPPAEELLKYKDVDPSFPEKILNMALKEQEHRHGLQNRDKDLDFDYLDAQKEDHKKVLSIESRNTLFGIIFAFITSMTGLIAGAVLIFYGKSITGTFFGLGSLTGLVSAFIYGTKTNKNKEKEESQKKEQNKT